MSIVSKINRLRKKIIKVLVGKGVHVSDNDLPLSVLIEKLLDLDILDNVTEFNYGVELDDIGYIKNIIKIDRSVSRRAQEIPKDVLRGYYFIDEHGKITLDEERKRLIE